jgi:hypothetical protein
MNTTTNHGTLISLPSPEPPPPRNGAYCNAHGSIHLRVVSRDSSQPDWPIQEVSHGISIEEAHCIAMELLAAIHESSAMETGRRPKVTI